MDIKYIAAIQTLNSLGYVWKYDEWVAPKEEKVVFIVSECYFDGAHESCTVEKVFEDEAKAMAWADYQDPFDPNEFRRYTKVVVD
jgi:hypothetical protein